MSVAFFDFDKTLIEKNSGTLWLKHELRAGRVSKWTGLRAGWWLTRYSFGFTDLEEGIRDAIRMIAGDSEAEMRVRVHDWYREEVDHLYRPGGQVALQRHREQGHKLVLLTSASNYLSEVVLEANRLDHFLANRFEVDAAGRYTGEPQGALCYGPGKLTHAKAYLDEVGAQLEDCWFYTDSMADLAVLEAVGHPVAVNPDPRLERVARKNGWPVEDWGLAAPRRTGTG